MYNKDQLLIEIRVEYCQKKIDEIFKIWLLKKPICFQCVNACDTLVINVQSNYVSICYDMYFWCICVYVSFRIKYVCEKYALIHAPIM